MRLDEFVRVIGVNDERIGDQMVFERRGYVMLLLLLLLAI
jgi:hypothetical protein